MTATMARRTTPPLSADRIVVAGALAQRPGYGGHTWVLLQYLLGFLRLGWDVLFLDRLDPEMCVDDRGIPCPPEASVNATYFARVMDGFGLRERSSLLVDGRSVVGVDRLKAIEWTRGAALLLDVMGYLDDKDVLEAARRRVFLDIDPGFPQMWRALELANVFEGHDDFVTIGEAIGQAGCPIPTCGLDWITTPPPIVLSHWPMRAGGDGAFTTVATWRGPNGPIEFGGVSYGLRAHEFRRFAALPRLVGGDFTAAMEIAPEDATDRERLEAAGWTLVDPRAVAADPWAYRAFIQGSGAELMVAKGLYADTQGGWFSDRSICYLASGKPVLAQDTGFGRRYPTGEGLFAFSTVEEAAAGVEDIRRNYRRHSRAAREIAEEHFDSDRVLTRLLDRLGEVA
jgi:hypothetical protein